MTSIATKSLTKSPQPTYHIMGLNLYVTYILFKCMKGFNWGKRGRGLAPTPGPYIYIHMTIPKFAEGIIHRVDEYIIWYIYYTIYHVIIHGRLSYITNVYMV